ncbi:MAG: hypothetical protein MJ154_01200 [Candidatus Saccharibacteria bacterium]|nr:hypothetical protein [Candidatus Saccharibacteria bacterium]
MKKNNIEDLLGITNSAVSTVNSTVNQAAATQLEAIDKVAQGMSAGFEMTNSTINQGVAVINENTDRQADRLEKNLGRKIDESGKEAKHDGLEWLIVCLITFLSGLGGWFITRAEAAKVWFATVTDEVVKDAAGNILSTTTISTDTNYLAVVLFVALFALIGFLLADIYVGRSKRG